jgi:predicted GH43/DUF377 family glycosyl hydrolase
LSAPRRRLVRRGQIPGSNGGIYNPGAVVEDGVIRLLCRREIDYRFTSFVYPELITLDASTLAVLDTRTLTRVGYRDGVRLEDFRSLMFEGMHLVVHTTVDGRTIRPSLSRILDDTLQPFDDLALPIELQRVEKNWVLFEHGGALHCLYKLDPLTIFRRAPDGSWTCIVEDENGWSGSVAGTLSNSTNLVPFEGGYLGFWHTIDDGRYVQGAMFLNADLEITYATGTLLDGGDVREGFKPGVLYVSALVADAARVLAFYGEGDSHTGVAEFDRAALWDALRASPFERRSPLRVRLHAQTLGDLFRALHVLEARNVDREPERIAVAIEEPRLRRTFGTLCPPWIVVRADRPSLAADLTLDGRTGTLTRAARKAAEHERGASESFTERGPATQVEGAPA